LATLATFQLARLLRRGTTPCRIPETRRVRFAKRIIVAAIAVILCTSEFGNAALTFNVDPSSPWPSGWYTAAVANMQTTVNMYNAYGDFTQSNSGNIYVYYNAGIPTAQSGYGPYGGSIGIGGTYPNVRVLLHESSHWLGTGTYSANWGGPHASALIQQFDGVGVILNGDSQHYWPYGENYDNESSQINDARHVAMVYALREDFGIGSTASPSTATNVTLTTSDALGTSSFNYPFNWSDTHFAQPGTNYSTGNFTIRTPLDQYTPTNPTPSFDFVGSSLTINNTNGINGGLLFKGVGTTSILNFKNLILNGGYVRHASGSGDLFQLAGNVTLTQSPIIDAAQGNIKILAPIGGTGSLTKTGSYTLTLTGEGSYSGNTNVNGGILRLAPVSPIASYTFDNVSGSTVVNGGTGGTGMNGTLTGGATIVAGGQSGNAVSLSGGASVNINNPITDLGNFGNWTVSAWVKTSTPGSTILTKGDGSTWTTGNTIFYLGDGTAGGSGGIPSSVRYAGGFFQGSTSANNVANNAWHQVSYVDNGGVYSIYVDGSSVPLSNGNSSFGNVDVGSVVRLGATTNTVAGDGTVNFNGLMDNVQFYSQALTAGQVKELSANFNLFGSLPQTTVVSIASGATFDLNGATQGISGLTGPSGSSVTLGSGQLTVSTSAVSQFDGSISGSGSLIKKGNSSFTLTGANTYTGPTTVSAGTLRVNGSLAGAATVNSGAILQGSGTIAGLVTIASGGTLAPGNSPGILTVGSLNLNSGSQTQIEIGGTSRSVQYDAVVVNGGATLGGALNVSLINSFSPAMGNSFDVLDWTSKSGLFSSLSLPALSTGLAWNTTKLYLDGSLSVIDGNYLPGDLDRDGHATSADLAALLSALSDLTDYQSTAGLGGSPLTDQQLLQIADLNGDGSVTNEDIQGLIFYLSHSSSFAAGSPLPVPEPSSFALGAIVASVIGISVAWRNRRRHIVWITIAACLALSSASLALANPPDSTDRLVFADEFDGNSLDTSKWSAASPSWTMPNSASTASAGQVNVGNGILTLNAVRTGSSTFTSGSVASYNKFNFTGGYVEARIDLPSTLGSWPAFWGLYTGWPPEADIMEYPITTDGGTSGLANNKYNTSFHYTNSGGSAAAGAGVVTAGSNLGTSGYHTFGMDWTTGTSVRFYLDGNQVQSFNNSAVAQMVYMYMILDYAVGGWPGTPTTTQWPLGFSDQTKIDWVRVWQHNPNNDATSTWNVNGGGSFTTAANWTGGGVPSYGNQPVVFGRVGTASNASITMSSWQVMGNITFNGDATGTTAYTVGSSSNLLQLSSTATSGPFVTASASSTASQTIGANLELQSNTTIRNDMTGGQTLNLTGGVTGPGQLTVEGVGTVVLSSPGSYLGGTVINGNAQGPAVLRATAKNALGPGTVVIGTGGNATTARLETTNNIVLPNNIDLRGRTNGSVAIENVSGNNEISGTVGTNTGGSVYQIQSDAGNLTLSGLSAGATARGVAVQSLATGQRTVTLQGAGNGAVSGIIRDGSGVVSIDKEGTGIWAFSGANTYSGTTTINGGTLRLSTPASVSLPTPIGKYNFNNLSGSTVINDGSGGSAMNGTLNLNGGTGSINATGGPTSALGALNLNGDGTTVDINSGITNLSSASTWTVSLWVKTSQPGMTLLNKGDGTNWSSGYSTFYLGDGADDGIGGVPDAVRYAGGWVAGSTQVNDGNWHLVTYTNAAGTKSVYVDGALSTLSQNQFTTADTGSIIRLGFSPNSEVDGNVRPAGSLSGVNIYSSALSAAQVAAIYNTTYAGTGSPLPSSNNVTIAAGATLDVNGLQQTIGSLTGAAGSAVTLGSGQLTVSTLASTSFDGSISGSGGSFTKQGLGTLSLGGANTYTGPTTINLGTLRVNGSIAGAATVNSGGVLGGSGSIAGLVTVASGGVLAPGSSPGMLTVGSLALNAGSQTQIELGGINRGSQYDAVFSSGNVSLGGALNVSLINSFSPALGNSFDILDWTSKSGLFSSLSLPALSAGLAWNTTKLYSDGSLSVIDANYLPGDLDRDGHATSADLAALLSALADLTDYQSTSGPGGSGLTDQQLLQIADLNSDGSVTNEDIQALIFYLANSAAFAAGSPLPVPEPSSCLLCALGIWALALANRRRPARQPPSQIVDKNELASR
jgi:autotransporter-associated beta strand protein